MPLPGRRSRRCSLDARNRLEPRQCARSSPSDTPRRGRQAAQAAGPDAAPAGRSKHLDARRPTGATTATSTFVSGSPEHPRLEIAPLDVGPVAARRVWAQRTAVLTSATIPPSLAGTGRPAAGPFDVARRRQPVRLRRTNAPAVLRHAPARPPSARLSATAVHDELVALITAAGGRTLALFTSWKAMDARRRGGRATASTCRSSPSATSRSRRWCAAFAADEATCLFATAGFFQGVDVPGRTLSLVVDRPAPVPAPRRPAAVGAARAPRRRRVRRDRRAAGRDDARPGDRTADPHRRPIVAWSPCSTAASARPATAGTSSRRCHRCSAPATAARSRRSSRDHRRLGTVGDVSSELVHVPHRRRRRRDDHPRLAGATATRCPRSSSATCYAALDRAERGIDDGSVRVIVLDHTPPVFCAGCRPQGAAHRAGRLVAPIVGALQRLMDGAGADDRRRQRAGARRRDRADGRVRPRRRAVRRHLRPHRGAHRRGRGDHLGADPAPRQRVEVGGGVPHRRDLLRRRPPATPAWSPTSPTTSRPRSPRCARACAWVRPSRCAPPRSCCAAANRVTISPRDSVVRRRCRTSCSPAPRPPRGWPPSPRGGHPAGNSADGAALPRRAPDHRPARRTARRARPTTRWSIVAGETGSGKSTQLPKLLLEAGRGVHGLIGHTQPRRVAARTIAERVADELGTTIGGAVGFTVRFNDRVGDETVIRVMTDGILLAELPRDRMLARYDALIIDEAHERSLNIDFILGYLRQLLPRRPDLQVVVTSATIDTERFAHHFARDGVDAPIVEITGRTYPVEMRYRPPAPTTATRCRPSSTPSASSARGKRRRPGVPVRRAGDPRHRRRARSAGTAAASRCCRCTPGCRRPSSTGSSSPTRRGGWC